MSIVIYAFIVFFTVAQSSSTKLFAAVNDNSAAFNQIKSLSALVLLLLMSVFGFRFDLGTALYGSLFGVLMAVSMQTGYKALTLGAMSVTSMIVSFSVAIPVVYGIIFKNDGITLHKTAGLILLGAALVFTSLKPKQKGEKRSLKWAFYVFLTFVANGFNSILQKAYREKYHSAQGIEFMVWAMLICFVVFALCDLKNISPKKLWNVRAKGYGICAGAANSLVGYLTIKLAGAENASVLFPAISAGTILGTILAGRLLFGEKLKINHIAALICGVTSVVMLKL